MTFERLEHLAHYGALVQQIGEPHHVLRVEHVYLQKEAVAYVVSEERNALDQGYVSDEG